MDFYFFTNLKAPKYLDNITMATPVYKALASSCVQCVIVRLASLAAFPFRSSLFSQSTFYSLHVFSFFLKTEYKIAAYKLSAKNFSRSLATVNPAIKLYWTEANTKFRNDKELMKSIINRMPTNCTLSLFFLAGFANPTL